MSLRPGWILRPRGTPETWSGRGTSACRTCHWKTSSLPSRGGGCVTDPAGTRTADPAALWRHSDFMKLWSAQTISAFGDQFTGLAIHLIAALTLQATAGQMGILTAVERAPFLLIGLLAGLWLDRWPRRPILITG